MKPVHILVLSFHLLITSPLFAFDSYVAHRRLTRSAFEMIKPQLGFYATKVLGFEGGIEYFINNSQMVDWLRDGSFSEDIPPCRASNHFHNPLRDWNESGMRDQPGIVSFWCEDSEYPSENIHAAVHWATGYVEPAPDGQKVSTLNQWDWDHAREYFYAYLTGMDFQGYVVAQSLETREEYFSKSLQALGHVLHMNQDMAVPSHTRDDFSAHMEWLGIKKENLTKPREWIGERFEYYVQRHFLELLSGGVSAVNHSNPSLTIYWDSNQYQQQDPDSLDTQQIGLAEFTNMNFPSKNTVFSEDLDPEDAYYQPYPRKSSTDVASYILREKLPQSVLGEDNIPDLRFHIAKTGDGIQYPYFAAPTYFTRDVQYEPGVDARLFYRSFKIDDRCVREYALNLLPKAIGYSAALLDYFFRGIIEIRAPIELVHSAPDDLTSPIVTIKAWLSNGTPDEAMINSDPENKGQLTAVVQYVESGVTSYAVSKTKEILELSDTDPKVFTFDFSNSPIPADITDFRFQVVYKGTLGNEKETAVAVGMKHPEPTLEIVSPDKFAYAVIDGVIEEGKSQQEFTKVKAKVAGFINPIPFEQGDSIVAVARYRNRTDYQSDLSNEPPTTVSIESSFSEATSESVPLSSPLGTEPTEFEFDFSANPIPVGITDLYLEIMYESGSEGTLVTAGMKDLNEPMHISYINATDKFYLDSTLRTAQEIVSTPALLDRVDFDHDGIPNEPGEPYINPYLLDFRMLFYNDTPPEPSEQEDFHAVYAHVPPERCIKTIVLVGSRDFKAQIDVESDDPANSIYDVYTLLLSGVINQEFDVESFTFTTVNSLRGIKSHQARGCTNYWPDTAGIGTAPWPDLGNLEPFPAQSVNP